MQKAGSGFHTPLQQLFLLEERVRLAGARLPDETDMSQRFHGIKCVVNGSHCIINMREVAEVFDAKSVTPIPGAAKWIEGVLNYRGMLVPVFRPHEYLSTSESADSALASCNGPLMVLRKVNKRNEFIAIRVNRMFGMQKFLSEDQQRLNHNTSGSNALENYVDNIISNDGKNWLRLDTQRLLDQMSTENPQHQH